MTIGMVGLGRMGSAVAYRLLQAGHEVWGFDPDDTAAQSARQMGVQLAGNIPELCPHARVVMIMVPAGDVTGAVIDELADGMQRGDIIIDGGNSNFHDSIRRAQCLSGRDIFFLDCGVSGGLQGKGRGFCLMIGGDVAAYQKVHPLLAAIATPGGLAHVGPSGAGHYVKMVHNGIEYGMLQAYGEGFALIRDGHFKKAALDLEEISRIWNHGAIIRSWLLELAHEVFEHDQGLHHVSGALAEGGTGRWSVEEAEAHDIPLPVIEAALAAREWSRLTGGNYGTKVVALLRNKFGGHEVGKVSDENN